MPSKLGDNVRDEFYKKLIYKHLDWLNGIAKAISTGLDEGFWECSFTFPLNIDRVDRIHFIKYFEREGFNTTVITSGLDEGPITFKLNWE